MPMTPETRSAADLVNLLNCPPAPTFEMIKDSVAERHGKEIVLHPVEDLELQNMTGLWIETEQTSHVFYRLADPMIYQLHSIFHEFGHILADHGACSVLSAVGDLSRVKPSGSMIQRARARGLTDDDAEQFAEDIAYALSQNLLLSPEPGMCSAFE